jgi:transposase
MKREELAALSKEELIHLIQEMFEQQARLMAAFQQLQADHEALKLKFERNQKPPTTSKNSSQPPSRDQKSNLPKNRRRRKHGPPAGHAKHERKFVAQADQVINMRAQECGSYQADLKAESGQLVKVNQITELPEASAQVIEVRQYEIACPHCGQKETAQPAPGLEMERSFGARLEATVVYYRQEQHMSYVRTQKALWDLYGVQVSQGGIDKIMQRAGKHALRQTASIQEKVASSRTVYCDETGSRVDGNTWWEWVFCTLNAVLHVVRDNRSVDTIREVMGENIAEVWVSDCLTSQLKAPAKQHQLCLAHQLRNLQAVVDAHPHLFWPRAMQAMFREAIHLHHQRSQLAPGNFARHVERIERLCDRLLERSHAPPEAGRLLRRYKKYRQSLFVCLHRVDVEPTNNVSERALRASVVHRKVSNGFRAEWGAKAYAALASVIDTGELSGLSAFHSIQNLFGKPALPLPSRG